MIEVILVMSFVSVLIWTLDSLEQWSLEDEESQ